MKFEPKQIGFDGARSTIETNCNWSEVYDAANLYVKQERWSEAIAAYYRVIELNPSFFWSHHNLGDVLTKLQRWDEAAVIYRRAIQLNPNFFWSHHNLGDVLTKLQRWDEVIPAYFNAIQLDANAPLIYQKLGMALRERGNLTESIQYYRQVIRHPERYPTYGHLRECSELLWQIGNNLAQKDQISGAIILYYIVLEIEPDRLEIVPQLKKLLQKHNQLQEAIKYYQKAISLNPQWFKPYFHLGNIYCQLNKLELAATFYRQAIEYHSFEQSFHLYLALGNVYLKQNKIDLAIYCYQKSININPQAIEPQLKLGLVYSQQSNWHKAIDTYNQVIKINPNYHLAWFRLGEIFRQQNLLEQAITNYHQALKIKANDVKIFHKLQTCLAKKHFQIAEQLRAKGKIQEAINNYLCAVKANPNKIKYYQNLGKLLEQQGKLEQAGETYKLMLEHNPNFPQGYRQLGLTLAKQKKWDEAIKYLLKALYIEPGFIKVVHDIGHILEQQDKLKDAVICYKSQNIPLDLIRKYSQSKKEWSVVDKCSSMKGVKYLDIYPASQNRLLPPQSIDRDIPDILSKAQINFQPSYVTLVDNGRAWADQCTSAIMTPSNQLLANVSTGCSNLIVTSDNLPSAYEIEGTVAFLSSRWSNLYFHWMLETLPRIELLRQSSIDLNSIDKFCFHRCDTRFSQETLNVLGIPCEKIIGSYEYPYIKARKLVVPSIIRGSRGVNWVINFLRREFLHKQVSTSDYPKRIYISRKSKRRILNEAEVKDLLGKYGFKSVTLESMSIIEQASLLATAEVVLAPHGAGLTNIVFCPSDAKIIEIFSPRYIHDCYWSLSNQCGLEYYYLVGENLVDETKQDGDQDILVNLNSLSKTLEFAGVGSNGT